MEFKRSSPEARAQTVAALFAVVCYIPAIKNSFAFDDGFIVSGNQWIHSWVGVPTALRLGYWYNSGHLYRPLTTLSFAVDWISSGGAPALFHAVNIAWHALATVLVARLGLRWWSPSAAAVAACIFALQPVHVEAVASIVGRSDVMCTVALLGLTLVATRPAAAASGRARGNELLGIAALAALATASKELGVVAPVLAWAASWLTLSDRPEGPSIAARRATIQVTVAACAGVSFLLAIRLLVLGAPGGDSPHPAFGTSTVWQGTALALESIPRAISLVIVPQPPRLDYSPTEAVVTHPNGALVIFGMLLVASVLLAVLAHAKRPTPWTLAVIFSAATFAPVSNLLIRSGIVIAERTLYAPSVGVALLEGATLAALGRTRPRLMAGALLVLLLASMTFTLQAIPIWRDTSSVLAAMRERAPASYRAYSFSAMASDVEGDHVAARRYYAQAISLFSREGNVLRGASANALVVGDTATALAYLTKALSIDPADTVARTTMTKVLMRRGDTAGARHLLREGLHEFPKR